MEELQKKVEELTLEVQILKEEIAELKASFVKAIPEEPTLPAEIEMEKVKALWKEHIGGNLQISKFHEYFPDWFGQPYKLSAEKGSDVAQINYL